MYAISLTSIPPRLPKLGPVLDSLLAQVPAPVAVYLVLPRVWARFGAMACPFEGPEGVQVLEREVDVGPCMKLMCFQYGPPSDVQRLIYCDDDWIYPQGWAAALLSAGSPGQAVAASGFGVERLKRRGGTQAEGFTDIAQGFGGVSVDPRWVSFPDCVPPEAARLADDIWISGQLRRRGVPIRLCSAARAGLRPAYEDKHGLQDVVEAGRTRGEVNRAALEELTARYGIWPAV